MTLKITDVVSFIKKLHVKLNKNNKNYNKTDNKFKTKKDFQIDPVTKFDLDTEKLIRKEINIRYKNHNIVGEEFNKQLHGSEYTWYIDPIDGTKSLIMGLPNWSNLIGLYKKKECILSYANFPLLNKYYLSYGSNTYLINKGIKKKIKCNKNVKVQNSKLIINTLHCLREKKVLDYIMSYKGFFKVTGADSLNFCSIAEGKFDVMIESGLKIVDIYPLKLIVKNSGAIMTDWNGKNIFDKGRVLISPNKKVHNYYLKLLSKL